MTRAVIASISIRNITPPLMKLGPANLKVFENIQQKKKKENKIFVNREKKKEKNYVMSLV